MGNIFPGKPLCMIPSFGGVAEGRGGFCPKGALRKRHSGFRCALAAAALALLAPRAGAQTIYVSTNGSHNSPFSSWTDAATNIHEAVALANTLVRNVQVSNGLYQLTNQLVISEGITLQGVNGYSNTILRANGTSGGYRVLLLTNSCADAVVDGFTLTYGYDGTNGGGIYMTNGTVKNCEIVGCSVGVWVTRGNAGGIWMSAGLVTNSTIRACQSFNENGALLASGGLVVDCTIINNTNNYVCNASLSGNAIMRRCRVFGNYVGYCGGGVSLGGSAVLDSSIVASNRIGASQNTDNSSGGGIRMSGGTVVNCLVYSNYAHWGGGVSLYSGNGRLLNTTIADNRSGAGGGGGLYREPGTGKGTATNCIIYGNHKLTASDDYNGDVSCVSFSCASDLTPGANGNISDDPLFEDPAAFNYHLQFNSPCVDAGTNLVSVTNDIEMALRPLDGDGIGGADTDMGAYEVMDASTGPLRVTFSGTPRTGLTSIDTVFTVYPAGADPAITWYGWDFNGNGSFEMTGAGLGVVTQNFTVGQHTVALLVSNATEGAWVTNVNYIAVSVPDMYVATNSAAAFPYNSWATAATSIHDVVDIAADGTTIHISNGTHLVEYPIVLNGGITLRGDFGAANTILAGDSSYGIIQMMSANTVVERLTIDNGNAGTAQGGGVLMYNGLLNDCIITNCRALNGAGLYVENGLASNLLVVGCVGLSNGKGGGMYMTGGKLARSTIRACTAWGGSGDSAGFYATGGTLEDCTIEECVSGYISANYAANTTIRRCRIARNRTSYYAAGVTLSGTSVLDSCVVVSNQALAAGSVDNSSGGGVFMQGGGTVVNCLVASNSAYWGGGVSLYGGSGRMINTTIADNRSVDVGGGVWRRTIATAGTMTNCIVSGNHRGSNPDDYYGDVSCVAYSCAPELTNGVNGNITVDPLFKSAAQGDFHLQPGSPCINTGTNFPDSATSTDLDGLPRLRYGRVDMGAYETVNPNGSLLVVR